MPVGYHNLIAKKLCFQTESLSSSIDTGNKIKACFNSKKLEKQVTILYFAFLVVFFFNLLNEALAGLLLRFSFAFPLKDFSYFEPLVFLFFLAFCSPWLFCFSSDGFFLPLVLASSCLAENTFFFLLDPLPCSTRFVFMRCR